MLFLLVSYSPLARRQVRASIYPVSRASAWLVVAAPAPPKPTKTREFAARQETAAKTLKVLNSLGLRASRAMATVVESEEVKTDEEKAVKKVVEENEPESAGGCDVCLPPNGLIGCSSYNYKYLCLPSMPWSRGGVAPPQFLGKDARLPLLLALVMGFQTRSARSRRCSSTCCCPRTGC